MLLNGIASIGKLSLAKCYTVNTKLLFSTCDIMWKYGENIKSWDFSKFSVSHTHTNTHTQAHAIIQHHAAIQCLQSRKLSIIPLILDRSLRLMEIWLHTCVCVCVCVCMSLCVRGLSV